MVKKAHLVLLAMAFLTTLIACGGTTQQGDAQMTAIAAGVEATLQAQAPVPTVVVTGSQPELPTVIVTSPPGEAGQDEPTQVIQLEADGSGDLPNLQEALAAPGATHIKLGRGTYRLDSAVTVAEAIRLEGAGRDQTEIISNSPDWVLRFEGKGPFTVDGITFRHDGTEPADIVVIAGSEVHIVGCRFSGGVQGNDTDMGSGLYLFGTGNGEIRDSEFSGNELHGLLLMENAQPLLAGNSATGNGDSGFAYFDQAAGNAQGNMVSKNAQYGVYLDGETKPTLDGNTITGNGASGIGYWGRSSGVARNNQCTQNGQNGIYLNEEAAPILEGNTCQENSDSGITYWGRSAGTARQNLCVANVTHGIYVDDDAAPALEGNTCRDNGDSGIAYFGNSAGLAQGNICSDNAYNDIYVSAEANPAIMENQCQVSGKSAAPSPQPGEDQGKIAFASDRDGNLEIYAMNADGSDLVRLTNNEAADFLPVWSPDGSRIAFLSTRNGNAQVYVMDADGSNQTRLTEALIAESMLSWSPDGTRLAFSSYSGGGGNDIYIMNISDRMDAFGQGATRLTTDMASDRDPAWSPDGVHIAFISDRTGEDDVHLMGADGNSQTPITMISGWKYGLACSPDGARMLFVLDEAVHVIRADGTGLARISGLVDDSSRAAWSPDSRRIVYQFENDLYVVNLSGSENMRLTNDPAIERDPSWWGPSSGQAGLSRPRWNGGGEPWCLNTPDEVFAGDWQVSAPREVVLPGDPAEIGLRNKAAAGSAVLTSYPITAQIIAPDGSEATASGTLMGDEWVTLLSPQDFAGGDTLQRGAYTILWTSQGVFIACDGFSVGGGASGG